MRAGALGRYRQIKIDGANYQASRLAVLWMTGQWPKRKYDVDHRNLNKGDDRWSNLREATRSQNKANIPGRSRAGLKGVTFNPVRGKYIAQITVNRRAVNLGRFDDPQSAHAAYVAAASKHFGQFARDA